MKHIKLLIIILLALIITGCASAETKEAKMTSDFDTVCQNHEFTTENNMVNYYGINYITDSVIATQNDLTIEMVMYDNEENAKKAQDEQIEVFNRTRGSGSVINKKEGKNFYRYIMISNNYYMGSSRIDNTLIFFRTDLANKAKVEAILNDMNY